MLEKYQQSMLEDICRLIKIPSVFEESSEYPFGANINRCLDEALDIMARLGFRTYKSPDNMYGYAEVGEGELFGVLGHLDVVNARKEDGWEHDPFQPIIQGEYLCGRGTQDDKGPVMAAAYALKSLLDDGFQLKKRIRFIFGIDEETLWRSIQAYKENEEAPASGFTPDSTFPLTYAEKGLLQILIRSSEAFPIPCSGGDSFNAVSSHASCPRNDRIEQALAILNLPHHVTETEICVEGVTAHAKNPWKGVSANLNLLHAMYKAGYSNHAIDFACNVLDGKYRFEGFTDNDLSDFSGPVTVNLGKIEGNENGSVFSIDLRLPVGQKKEDILELIRKKASEYSLVVEEFDWLRPIHVPLDSPLVQNLLNAYQDITGDTETEPYISAGATYARAFDNCVAFGANMPDTPTSEHQPNERVPISKLMKAAEVYRKAFEKLVIVK